MRLLFYWMSVFSLMLASSSRAASELVVGVLPYQPVRMLITSHTALATHLQQTLKRPVRLVTARDARVFGQRILAGDYDLALAPAHLARRDAAGATPATLRTIAVDQDALTAMDPYLPPTRQRLLTPNGSAVARQ